MNTIVMYLPDNIVKFQEGFPEETVLKWRSVEYYELLELTNLRAKNLI